MNSMKKQWRKLTASSFVFYYIYPILFSVLYVVIKLSFFHCKYEDHFIIILPLFMFYYRVRIVEKQESVRIPLTFLHI